MMVEILLKGGLVLLACRAIAWSLGRRGAATRHLVLAAGLAGAAALPLLAWVLPPLRVPMPARVAVQRVEPPSPGIAPIAAESPRVVWEDPGPAPLTRASPDTRLPWGILYGSVTVALLGLSVAGRVRLRRLLADATEVPPGDPRRRVFQDLLAGRSGGRRLLESAACPVPMALGWRPGRVVLPADSRGWPDARLRAVLLHEIAHLERGDAPWRLVGEVACAVHWIDPLAWLAARRLRRESEEACDDAVLRSGYPSHRYASDLLALSVDRRWAWNATGAFALRGTLEGRVAGVLDAGRAHGPASRAAGASAVAATLLLLPLLAAAVPGPGSSVGDSRVTAAPAPIPPPSGRDAPGEAPRPMPEDPAESVGNATPVQTRWAGRGAIGGLALEGAIDLEDPSAADWPAFLLVAFRGDDGALGTLQAVRGPRGAWNAVTEDARRAGEGLDAPWLDDAFRAAGRKLAELGEGVRWRGEPLGRAGDSRLAPGLAGSVMTGLPATTVDSSRGSLLAGWRHDERRAGLFLCGTAGVDPWDTVRRVRSEGVLDNAVPDGDCLVAWAWRADTGSFEVLEVVAGKPGPRVRFTVDGAERAPDPAWPRELLRTLDAAGEP